MYLLHIKKSDEYSDEKGAVYRGDLHKSGFEEL